MAKNMKEIFKDVINEALSCMEAIDDPAKKGTLAANIALALANSGAINIDTEVETDKGTKEDLKKPVIKQEKKTEAKKPVAPPVEENPKSVREQLDEDQVWTEEKLKEHEEEIAFIKMLQDDTENHEVLKQCVAQLTSGIYEDFSLDMPPATVTELYNFIQTMLSE